LGHLKSEVGNEKKFENGLRVHIEGDKNGDLVKASKLKILSQS